MGLWDFPGELKKGNEMMQWRCLKGRWNPLGLLDRYVTDTLKSLKKFLCPKVEISHETQ